MIKQFCPGYSYARTCDGNCDECPGVIWDQVPRMLSLVNNGLIYLASPYSSNDPAVQEQRFHDVCKVSAELMRQGHIIISPIAHTHPIAKYGLPTDWEFWKRQDEEIISRCDELWVLMLDGWGQSKGVLAEMNLADELGKTIRLVNSKNCEVMPAEETEQQKNTPVTTEAFKKGKN